MQKLSKKRSKNRSYPPYGCDTTNSWSRAFWLCGTVKLWFEGGKKHLAHLSEVALGGTAGTGLNTLLVMMLQLQNTLLNSQDILCNGRK
jgi:hypothetical protein